MGPEHWETNWRPDRNWGCGAYLLIGAWLLLCLGLALPGTGSNLIFMLSAKTERSAVITANRNPFDRGAAVQELTVQLPDGRQVRLETTAPGHELAHKFSEGDRIQVKCLKVRSERCRLPGLRYTAGPFLSWGPLLLTFTVWWTFRQPRFRAGLNR